VTANFRYLGTGNNTRAKNKFLLYPISGAQKRGKYVSSHNLKRLNSWVSFQYIKIKGIPTLHDLLQQGDWLGKVDLKDAYFSTR